jgi:hypothetical protein
MYTQEIACPSCGKLTIVNVPDLGQTITPCPHCKWKIIINVNSQGKVTSIEKRDPTCFVASAVYGSSEAPQVRKLQRLRDDVLLKHPIGRRLVRIYYTYSADIAAHLRNRHFLAKLVRYLLVSPIAAVAPRVCRLVLRQRVDPISPTDCNPRSDLWGKVEL